MIQHNHLAVIVIVKCGNGEDVQLHLVVKNRMHFIVVLFIILQQQQQQQQQQQWLDQRQQL